MGGCCSCCCENEEAKVKEEARLARIRAGAVYFNEKGNFCVNTSELQPFDRKLEAARIFEEDSRVSDRLTPAPAPKPYLPVERLKSADGIGEQKGEDGHGGLVTAEEEEDKAEPVVWYLVSSIWIEAWAAYVREGRVRPPPVSNHYLLRKTPDGFWEKNRRVKPAHKNGRGDYRRVGESVWRELESLYPGSGPAIKVTEMPPGEDEEWVISGNAELAAEIESTRPAASSAAGARDSTPGRAERERSVLFPLEIASAEGEGVKSGERERGQRGRAA